MGVSALFYTAPVSADALTTNGGEKIDYADLSYCVQDEEAPVVYYISDISPQSPVKIYEAMEWVCESHRSGKACGTKPAEK